MRTRLSLLCIAAAIACLGLGCKQPAADATNKKGEQMSITATGAATVTSQAFAQGQTIPKKYSGEGEDISPPLSWSNLPEGTAELALIVDDPDAPAGTWTHWVVYDIPARLAGFDEGASGKGSSKFPDAQIAEGRNSKGQVYYHGPMPPKGHGLHHYYFTLYALDKKLGLPKGIDKAALEKAMQGHILAKGQLIGTYERD